MTSLLRPLLICILLLACTLPLRADTQRTIRVGAFNYYPAIFKDTDGTVKGFYVDALADVARREGLRIEYRYGSWNEGLERIRSGEVDLLTSVARTPERTAFLDFGTVPLLTVWGELYVPHGSEIDGIRQMAGKTVAVMKGDVNAAHFKELAQKFNIECRFVELPGFDDVFAAVAAGTTDAGVANSTFGAARQRDYGLRSTGVAFNPFDIYFAAAKGQNRDLLEMLDRYLSGWRHQEDSVYNLARQQWSHGTVGVMRIVPRALSRVLFVLAAAVAVTGAFVVLLRLQVRRRTAELAAQIAEREEAEAANRLLSEQLLQAQRLESVGRLAGGIAHDFNNLLTPILGYAEIVMQNLPADSPDRQRITSIMRAADKARKLTQQLLSYGRKQVLEMTLLDVNEVVVSFQEILRRTIRENIDLRFHLTPEVCGVRADRHQLGQILMNLVVNANDAISGSGIIAVETAPVVLDEDYARQHAGVTPGPYLMLAISDTGCGMDDETRSHVFEPFFTTKGVGEGSGLGLATVYGLVQQHDGHIWVYSEPGKGTSFKLYFPVVGAAPAAVTDSTPAPAPTAARDHTILLVEDDDMVREMTRDLLTSLGMRVIDAPLPAVALKAAAGRQIDLLLSDVIMPGMTGPELYQQLSQLHPGLKVLYMSGYTNNVIAHHGVLDEGISFIQKPFSILGLSAKITAVLEQDGTGGQKPS